MNEAGQVVGWSQTADSVHAFLWEQGTMRDLGILPQGSYSRAHAINRYGLVVGTADFDDEIDAVHAVLWIDGKIVDLNTLLPPNSGWILEEARAINDRGQIVGQGRIGGTIHAFVLTPEDGSLPPTPSAAAQVAQR